MKNEVKIPQLDSLSLVHCGRENFCHKLIFRSFYTHSIFRWHRISRKINIYNDIFRAPPTHEKLEAQGSRTDTVFLPISGGTRSIEAFVLVE